MTRDDKIWLAAVIDCEGNITLGKSTRKGKNGIVSYTYGPHLNITNTYYPMIQRILGCYPGGNIVNSSRKASLGKKKCYNLDFNNKDDVRLILNDVQEFLMEKRELALKMIDWFDWYKINRSNWNRKTRQQKLAEKEEYISRSEYVRSFMSTNKPKDLIDQATV